MANNLCGVLCGLLAPGKLWSTCPAEGLAAAIFEEGERVVAVECGHVERGCGYR